MKRAVLLVDHGSRRAEANTHLEQLAEELRRRLPDRFVALGHLELLEPSIAAGVDACAAAGAEELTVVPYFLAPGRHTATDLPRLVEDAAGQHPQLRIHLTAPLGLHPRIPDLLTDLLDC